MIEEDRLKELIKECIEEIFFSEEEYSPFNSLQDKINKLLKMNKYEEHMKMSVEICDKFSNYMNNIDRLNQMINEFKGLVSIVRGEAAKISRNLDKVNDEN